MSSCAGLDHDHVAGVMAAVSTNIVDRWMQHATDSHSLLPHVSAFLRRLPDRQARQLIATWNHLFRPLFFHLPPLLTVFAPAACSKT